MKKIVEITRDIENELNGNVIRRMVINRLYFAQ
jgi:hypothetical protein